jgi:putative colanic acid biosynthesis glycosyltransferase WcaI
LRILIHGINFYPETAGVGKYTGEMAHWLAGAGHEVRVVTAPPSFPQWRVTTGYCAWRYDWRQLPSQPETLKVSRCPTWVPKNPNGLKRLLHLASFALSSLPVMLFQVLWHPDLVLLVEPTFCCAPQALLTARLAGATAWLHVQDFEVDAAFELGDITSSRGQILAHALERWLVRKFDRVSAISGQMVSRLLLKGVDQSRCVHFPNWVDTGAIFPLPNPSSFRRELGIADNVIVALYSGSMGKKQGLDLLVDTARQLLHRSDLRFVFCGDGSYQQVFVEKARGLTNVNILPFQPPERLNDLLNLADIHLLPQRAGAADLVMPSKLTGMLASGRPVLATATPGTELASAVLGHGIAVPPGDLNAFVSALLDLAADGDLRQTLGHAARKYAESHLNRDEILRRFERSLLNSGDIPSLDAEPFSTTRREIAVEKTTTAAGNIGDD